MINRNEKGSSAVEFALVAVLFLTLLFSIVEYAFMSYINLTMQHAVREGTRYVVTGQAEPDETWGATLDSQYLRDNRFRAMVEKIKSQSMGFFDKVLDPASDIVVEDVSGNGITRTFTYDFTDNGIDDPETWDAYVPGDPGNIIVVKLNCTWRLLTPFLKLFFTNGEYNFTVSSTMRNEKFDPGP